VVLVKERLAEREMGMVRRRRFWDVSERRGYKCGLRQVVFIPGGKLDRRGRTDSILMCYVDIKQ